MTKEMMTLLPSSFLQQKKGLKKIEKEKGGSSPSTSSFCH
jgi:hypothetical protein